ncbi:hypothetical protein N9969_03795, partial [Akkermansiaceae bacterium]|nr:hypothetical protein [Akkermansiaceae bacterium]
EDNHWFLAGGSFALSFIINERYLGSLILVPPVMAGCFFFGLFQFSMRPLVHAKKTKLVAGLTVFAALFNVRANLIFIPQYGAMAAA